MKCTHPLLPMSIILHIAQYKQNTALQKLKCLLAFVVLFFLFVSSFFLPVRSLGPLEGWHHARVSCWCQAGPHHNRRHILHRPRPPFPPFCPPHQYAPRSRRSRRPAIAKHIRPAWLSTLLSFYPRSHLPAGRPDPLPVFHPPQANRPSALTPPSFICQIGHGNTAAEAFYPDGSLWRQAINNNLSECISV